ncbi:hypothetical protein DC083_03015 [Ignatzschineria ureiclastica]|uniref:DUF2877 domain-containing protein n=1 Tax=Ignatzschineria ureiclastica TaxID=472582 RepID=A0A2U2AFJ4_9GAMM|nr:DUF2877 domain-containing protein [Ignatzschineria ureiclastica]PWD81434.1 hypothetical protein DC083_03015 [Ignatzschineria ureiclastica]GHA00695.1 hypothetical protein GCM10007162_16080 [Ignatzschineria ureiclastica]
MISILSIDQKWANLLQVGARYQIHSCFAHALNLIDERGQFATFLSADFPNGPLTLRVNTLPKATLEALQESAIPLQYQEQAGKGAFIAPGLCFTFSGETTYWESQLPIMDGSAQQPSNIKQSLQASLQLAKSLLPVRALDDRVMQYIYETLESQSTQLISAIVDNNLPEISRLAVKQIGLGMGLTPSGDDFLVGLMLILWLNPKRYQALLEQLQVTIEDSRTQTNEISWWMLNYAVSGRFNGWLQDYAKALVLADLTAQKKAVMQILTIGSSSGSDMVTGIVAGLRVLLKDNTMQE